MLSIAGNFSRWLIDGRQISLRGGTHAYSASRGLDSAGVLGGLALTETAGLLGLYPRPASVEPPLETTRIRLVYDPSICVGSQFIAAELLQAERYTDAQHVKGDQVRQV